MGGRLKSDSYCVTLAAIFPGWEQDFQHFFAVEACTFCLDASVVPYNVVTVLDLVVGMSLVVGSPPNSKK